MAPKSKSKKSARRARAGKGAKPASSRSARSISTNESPVNIAPGVGVYAMFPSFNYKPWLALGEFLDNSISSYQKHKAALQALNGPNFKLRILIDYDAEQGTIEIRDNAAGIDKNHFASAFALAKPPDDLRYISRYGVGMKAAACWFARDWSLRTSAVGESVERCLNWCTKSIIEGKADALIPVVRTVPSEEHYTVVTLRNLIHPPSGARTVAKVKSYLPNIYREFMRGGEIEILWNGQELQVEQHPVLRAPPHWDRSQPEREWNVQVALPMDDGRTIKGRIFLLQKMKRSYTALNLFWHNRLILGNVGENHRPVELFGPGNSFETGRLCVELFMDDYEPTVDKMGFKFQDNEATLEEIIVVLRREGEEILRQARDYRAPKIDPADIHPDVGALIAVSGRQVITRPAEATVADPYPSPVAPLPSSLESSRTLRRIPLVIDGSSWEVVVSLGNGGRDDVFVKIEESITGDVSEPLRLYITLGMQHPFVVNYWSDDLAVQNLLVVMASAIGFGEIAARRAGAKFPTYVRNNIDQFLRTYALEVSA
jgi:hypothetical protein